MRYDARLVKLYFKVRACSSGEDDEDDIEKQKTYFPAMWGEFSMTYAANNFPQNKEDLPEGVEPALHSLTFIPEQGILLCCGYYFKNSILEGNTEYFKKCLTKIVEDMDGVFLDGWGEGGFLYQNGAEEVSVSFENDLVMIVTDVPNVSSMHIKWTSISEIDNIGWLLHYKAYEWLYRGLRYYDQSSEQLKYLTDHKDLYFFA